MDFLLKQQVKDHIIEQLSDDEDCFFRDALKYIQDIEAENDKLKKRLQVVLRASNVLAHNKYPKTDYFSKP